MSYRNYIARFYQDENCIPAQLLYDWRAVTGFITGDTLHDIFRNLCKVEVTEESSKYEKQRFGIGISGEPSPSGYWQIPIAEITEKEYSVIEMAMNQSCDRNSFLNLALAYDKDFGVDAIQNQRDVEELRMFISKLAAQPNNVFVGGESDLALCRKN